jgi:hypothetical protein
MSFLSWKRFVVRNRAVFQRRWCTESTPAHVVLLEVVSSRTALYGVAGIPRACKEVVHEQVRAAEPNGE